MSEKLPPDPWVMLIGIGKLIKMASLLALGILALTLVHRDVADSLRRWAFDLGLNPGGKLVSTALAKAGGLDPKMLREIGVATFLYATLFGIEGTGLLLRKRWGEWVTTFITGSFIPIEVYETVLHPHIGRALFIVANVAAVAYLIHRLRQRHRAEASRAGRTGATTGAGKESGPSGEAGGAAIASAELRSEKARPTA